MSITSKLRTILVIFLIFWGSPSVSMTDKEAMELLGTDNVNEISLKKAYRRASSKYHPDKIQAKYAKELSPEELARELALANENMQKVIEAYDLLSGKAVTTESAGQSEPRYEKSYTAQDEVFVGTEDYFKQARNKAKLLYPDLQKYLEADPNLGASLARLYPFASKYKVVGLLASLIFETATFSYAPGLSLSAYFGAMAAKDNLAVKQQRAELNSKIFSLMNPHTNSDNEYQRLVKALKAYDQIEVALSLAETISDKNYSDIGRMAALASIIEKSPELGAAFLYRVFQGSRILRVSKHSVIHEYLISRKSWDKEFKLLKLAYMQAESPYFNQHIKSQIYSLQQDATKWTALQKLRLRYKYSLSSCKFSSAK